MTTTMLGEPVSRIEGDLKVTGRALYAAEIPIPNLRFALLRGATIAHGRIRKIDASDAEKLPGVRAIFTHKNMPRLGTDIQTFPKGTAGTRLLPMQDDKILYEGQYIACVVADTIEAAGRALGAIKVEYDEEPPIMFAKAIADGTLPQELHELNGDVSIDFSIAAPVTFEQGPDGKAPQALLDMLAKALNATRGNPEQGLRDAEVRLEGTYATTPIYQSPIEIGATIAVPDGERLTVYDSTQHVMGVRNALSRVLKMPLDRIRVITHFVGGAFGGKCFTWPHTMIAAAAARELGMPIKLMLNREQMFHGMGYRAPMLQKLELGAKRDGTLTALLHEGISATSITDVDIPPAVEMTKVLYACPNLKTRQAIFRCHIATPCRMRSPGEALGLFALESGMDELAHTLGMDPIELRLRNFAATHPETGRPFSSNGLRACYDEGAQRFGWYRRNPKPRSMRDGDFFIGMGMSSAIYPTMVSPVKARIRMLADGQAIGQAATQEIGQGSMTAYAQVIAQELGLPIARVSFSMGDTDLPPAPVSGGSRGAASVGSAVYLAARNLVARLTQLTCQDATSPLYRLTADEVEPANGGLRSKQEPRRQQSYKAILEQDGAAYVEADGAFYPWQANAADMAVTAAGTTRTFGPDGPEKHTFTYGANFVEVQVNRHTGHVHVSRAVGVFAAGRILNRKLAESQAMGGMIFGIGFALLEGSEIDENSGRLVSASLEDYHLPVNSDIHPVEVHFIDEYDAYSNPLGAKGVGEIGSTGTAAAVANAVFHATGVRVRDLPILSDRLIKTLN